MSSSAEPPRITIDWRASASEIPSELWDATFSPSLEGRWWYDVLERSNLEDQFRFAYGVISDGGRPVGIAPTFLMDVPIDLVAPPMVATVLRGLGRFVPRFRYQRTLFVGSPCSDEGTLGLVQGAPVAAVVDALQTDVERRARTARAPMIVWKDFPDEYRPELEALARRRGLFAVVSFPGTRVGLSGKSFEDYVMSLKIAKRHRLRRNLKRGKEACPLVASIVTAPDESVRREIFALFWKTYEHGKTKFERLTPEFFTAISAEPTSAYVLLRNATSGTLAAFMLLFRAGPRVINKFIGIDYALGRDARLYFQLWEHAVRWAYGVGATEIQSGQTGYPAKRDLGHELVPLTNFCKHKNPIIHRVFAMVGKTIDWASLDPDLARVADPESDDG